MRSLQHIFAFCFIVQSSLKTFIVKTKPKHTDNQHRMELHNKTGADYMDEQDTKKIKMVEKSEQRVEVGEAVNLKCISKSKITKCHYHNGGLRYRARPGDSYDGGRIRCLCDVSIQPTRSLVDLFMFQHDDTIDPEKVCGLRIQSVKRYDAGDWR